MKRYLSLLASALWLFICVAGATAQSASETGDKLVLDKTLFKNPCPKGIDCGDKPSEDFTVKIRAELRKPHDDIEYRYSVTGGFLMNSGREVTWNVENLMPGTYEVTMTPYRRNRSSGPTLRARINIFSAICICDCDCPKFFVHGSDKARNDEVISFTASISGAAEVTYNWTVENGEIISGQGTTELRVRVKRAGSNKVLKATAEFSGLDPVCGCPKFASAETYIID